MLLLCTTLFGTLAALHTCHPPRHTLPHCSLSHFFLQRTHAWWDHTPGPGAGVYYVWVGLSSRCLVSRLGEPENQGEAQHLSAADRGVAGVGGAGSSTARQRPGSGLVHVLCGLPGWCASSQSGSASDKPPVEVSCADSETEQRGKKRVEQHTCPHHWAGSTSPTAHLWIMYKPAFDD